MKRAALFGTSAAASWRDSVAVAVGRRDIPQVLRLLDLPGARTRLHGGFAYSSNCDFTFAQLCMVHSAPEVLAAVCAKAPGGITLDDCCWLCMHSGGLEVTAGYDLLANAVDDGRPEFVDVALQFGAAPERLTQLDGASGRTIHARALSELVTTRDGEKAKRLARICTLFADMGAPVADSYNKYPAGLAAAWLFGSVPTSDAANDCAFAIADLLPIYLDKGYVHLDRGEVAPVVQAARNGNGPLAARLIELGCAITPDMPDLIEVARRGKNLSRAEATAAAVAAALMSRRIDGALSPDRAPHRGPRRISRSV